jgi:DNA-binding transcriptional regulator GbsR (MarR family)
VECENESELRFACKLVAVDHNQWQTTSCNETLQRDMDETEEMEAEAKARMEAPLGEEDYLPEELVDEEEDISIDEWSQMGYKWFNKEDVVYL